MPENKRVKDIHNEHNHMLDGLTDNTRSFYTELSQYFPEVKITSGKRSAAQKVGTNYKHSHHNTGNAIDISAEHTDVYAFLMNDKRGLELLNKYNMGVLDETDPDAMKATGATGEHFHIGTDSNLVRKAKERYSKFDSGITPVYAYIDQKHTQPDPVTNQIIPVSYAPEFELVTPEIDPVMTLTRELKKEEIKQDKIEQSDARKAIEDKRNTLMEMMSKVQYINPQAQQEQPTPGIPIPELPDVQQSLPELPSIFSFQ